MTYKNLPYGCKELINLYCLNKFTDYIPLQEFNKICDYEPCKYSNKKLLKAERYYNKNIVHQEKERENFIDKALDKHNFIGCEFYCNNKKTIIDKYNNKMNNKYVYCLGKYDYYGGVYEYNDGHNRMCPRFKNTQHCIDCEFEIRKRNRFDVMLECLWSEYFRSINKIFEEYDMLKCKYCDTYYNSYDITMYRDCNHL